VLRMRTTSARVAKGYDTGKAGKQEAGSAGVASAAAECRAGGQGNAGGAISFFFFYQKAQM